jgi:hypothetical protein
MARPGALRLVLSCRRRCHWGRARACAGTDISPAVPAWLRHDARCISTAMHVYLLRVLFVMTALDPLGQRSRNICNNRRHSGDLSPLECAAVRVGHT